MVLDVKTGVGAFMENLSDARKLGEVMISIGEMVGRKVVVVLSDMNQPLGCAIGNSLEVIESINTLQGKGPSDLHEHCLVLSSNMLVLGKIANDINLAREMSEQVISDGSALQKFYEMVVAQGGDEKYVEDERNFQRAFATLADTQT